MTYNFSSKLYQAILGSLLLFAISCSAFAQPPWKKSVSSMKRRASSPRSICPGLCITCVIFRRITGKTLQIYYDRVQDATSTEPWQDDEVRTSPPSPLIPALP